MNRKVTVTITGTNDAPIITGYWDHRPSANLSETGCRPHCF